MGTAKSAQVKAALELGRRMLLAAPEDRLEVRSPGDVARILMAEMSHLEQEQFRVVLLDTRNRVVAFETVYQGSLNTSYIRTAEVFRSAVKRNCNALIAAHNHPSGDPTPSPEDVAVTRQLVAAGRLLSIELLDHLVIGQQRFVSLRERELGFD
jgi:DNA repair protein RadC